MAYREMYEIEITHPGLNKYRNIRGTDKYVVERKAQAQKAIWDEMWQKKCTAEEKKHKKEKLLHDIKSKKKNEIDRTNAAIEVIESLQNTLHFTLDIDDTIDWESLKDKSEYNIPKPKKTDLKKIPKEPLKTDLQFIPSINFLDKIFSSRKEKKIKTAEQKFLNSYKSFIEIKNEVEKENADLLINYKNEVNLWEQNKEKYYAQKEEANNHIEYKKKQYFEKNPDSILEYCDLVLSNSKYPDYFPQVYDLDYNPEN